MFLWLSSIADFYGKRDGSVFMIPPLPGWLENFSITISNSPAPWWWAIPRPTPWWVPLPLPLPEPGCLPLFAGTLACNKWRFKEDSGDYGGGRINILYEWFVINISISFNKLTKGWLSMNDWSILAMAAFSFSSVIILWPWTFLRK